MAIRNYDWQSDFAKRFVAQGKAEGRFEGWIESLITVLEQRGFAIDIVHKRYIRGAADVDVLKTWTRRAVTAATLDEVFE